MLHFESFGLSLLCFLGCHVKVLAVILGWDLPVGLSKCVVFIIFVAGVVCRGLPVCMSEVAVWW